VSGRIADLTDLALESRSPASYHVGIMRIEPRLLLLAAAVGMSGCVVGAASSDTRGVTRAHYAGPTTVRFTNASPDRMCGFYMTDDAEDSYGDNWLPEAGVPSGGSIDFAVKPGKYNIAVTVNGFQTFRATGVEVASNQVVRTNAVMQVGGVNESVTVESRAQVLDTDRATVSETPSPGTDTT